MAGNADEVLSVEARLIDNVTAQMKGMSKAVLVQFQAMGKMASSFKKSLGNVANSLFSIKGLILGAGMAKAFQATVGQASKFEAQMASVATLSQEMSDNIGKFSKEVLALSAQSGESLDTLTKSLFDSVSAGIGAGDAMEFLNTATRLAIGGATETAVAVDGLTTVMNAFELEADQANDIADAFFTAMKFGKTTVGELATSIGPLAPTAKAAGLAFDEMLGAVSALAKGGFNTKLAVTAMQGALVSINSITPEARKKMEGLGLATRVTGEKGSEFIDILNNIRTASGGTLEGMKKFIPSIEGARAILSLTTKQGANYKEVMRLMGDRAGETAKAYEKMSNTFEFKSKRVKESLNGAFIEIGNQIMPAMSDLADFLLNNMETIKKVMAFGIAFVKDAWNGLVFLFDVTIGTLKTAFNGLLTIWTSTVSGIFKVINMLPGSLIPEGWIKTMDEFADVSAQKTVSGVKDIVKASQELEESNIISFFDDTSKAVEASATSVKDLTDRQRELLSSNQQIAGGDDKKAEDKKAFLEQIKQLELDYQARTHEGRVALLESEEAELLERAKQYGINTLAITQEFDALHAEQAKAQADLLFGIEEKKQQKEDATNKAREAKRLSILKTNNTARENGQRRLTDALVSESARGLQALTKSEKGAQRIAMIASIIQGSLAVQRALATPPGPPFTIPNALAVGIMAGSNTATIASQAFEAGGFPMGKNAMIKVNERGQEAVLNARATANLGRQNIDQLNSGRGATITNEVVYSPTITIGQDANKDVLDLLANDKTAFANFLQEEVIDKGFLNVNQG